MYLRLLRHNRDFRLLYAGTLISLGGDWFLTVALLDLVLSLTGSATLASLMLLCQSLPIFIVTPLAGLVVDRVDRRKLMILVDVIRTGACLLPLLARSPALLPFAYAGVIVIAVGSSYFEPASQAALPNLVRDDELAPANVLMGSTWGTMLAVGAAIGGAVTMRFGRDVAFVVDAISFLASAAILWRMRARFAEERAAGHEHPPLIELFMARFPHLPKAAFAEFFLEHPFGVGHLLSYRRPPAQHQLSLCRHPLRFLRAGRGRDRTVRADAHFTHLNRLLQPPELIRPMIQPFQ